MSIFQRTTIALARSPLMGRTMRAMAARTSLARRFVGGADVDAAVQTALRLRDAHGIRASLFYLGEYVADAVAIEHNVSQTIDACRALGAAGLDVHVSIDPTAIGFMASDALGTENARRIGAAASAAASAAAGAAASHAARAARHWVVLDMEDSGIRDRTCALHRHLLEAGLPAGLTLQARRHRFHGCPRRLRAAARAHGRRSRLRARLGSLGARAAPPSHHARQTVRAPLWSAAAGVAAQLAGGARPRVATRWLAAGAGGARSGFRGSSPSDPRLQTGLRQHARRVAARGRSRFPDVVRAGRFHAVV